MNEKGLAYDRLRATIMKSQQLFPTKLHLIPFPASLSLLSPAFSSLPSLPPFFALAFTFFSFHGLQHIQITYSPPLFPPATLLPFYSPLYSPHLPFSCSSIHISQQSSSHLRPPSPLTIYQSIVYLCNNFLFNPRFLFPLTTPLPSLPHSITQICPLSFPLFPFPPHPASLLSTFHYRQFYSM